MVEIIALAFTAIHKQQFSHPHYCGIGSLPNVASVFQNQYPYSCCFHSPLSDGLIHAVIIMDVCLAIFKPCAPFYDMLQSHYAITIHLCQVAAILYGGSVFLP
jgi:hypothetical protein